MRSIRLTKAKNGWIVEGNVNIAPPRPRRHKTGIDILQAILEPANLQRLFTIVNKVKNGEDLSDEELSAPIINLNNDMQDGPLAGYETLIDDDDIDESLFVFNTFDEAASFIKERFDTAL